MVADLSFISLRTVLPAVLALARRGADLVLLVKPQFEAGREEAARGRGRDHRPRRVAAGARARSLPRSSSEGAAIMGVMASPLTGADGNVEFLAARAHRHRRGPSTSTPAIDAAIAEATGR